MVLLPQELERAMEVTSKAHSQEMKAALGKHRQSNREVDELQNSVRKLKWQLKASKECTTCICKHLIEKLHFKVNSTIFLTCRRKRRKSK